VNNLPKVATQWNSGTTRDSNRGRRVLIPSALTTRPWSHTDKYRMESVRIKNIVVTGEIDLAAGYIPSK